MSGSGAIGLGGIGQMAIGVSPGAPGPGPSTGLTQRMIVPPDSPATRLLVELTLKVRPE